MKKKMHKYLTADCIRHDEYGFLMMIIELVERRHPDVAVDLMKLRVENIADLIECEPESED
tara:strand:+ start:178 stop:360 length:183 start_codon:yes stop_codon:yes gene_type:complete